ncbi:MAG: 5-(carboxyamino)imidazole ribonucleotide mutase [Verrucomicrobia bacterium]|nr:5-(carboxyamino)imidazole ribonucleotide mutase [Verrucomicrobiota bacterium]MCH8526807.1 5-(carboxyamino)imidazole ribonucleotide mutase [Kiritimatiellia bacterium]
MKHPSPVVGIVMGSDSDLRIMGEAAEVLEELGVSCEVSIVSAHRTPERLFEYAASAAERGLKVVIAGAGGAAHLPGMIAAISPLPVIGVPVKSRNSIDGWDSLLSIVQMPAGVPVATVAVDGSKNAGILAAQILAVSDPALLDRIRIYKENLKSAVLEKVERIEADGWKALRG